jgi:hypothetical protein
MVWAAAPVAEVSPKYPRSWPTTARMSTVAVVTGAAGRTPVSDARTSSRLVAGSKSTQPVQTFPFSMSPGGEPSAIDRVFPFRLMPTWFSFGSPSLLFLQVSNSTATELLIPA